MNALSIKLLRPLLRILEKYRWGLFWVIYGFGVGVYVWVCHHAWYVALYEGLALFAMNVKTSGAGSDVWVYVAGFLAAFYTVLSAVSLVARQFVDKASLHESIQKPYILVCGLGDKAAAYIDSELAHDANVNIVAIEKDSEAPNIEKYRALGITVKVADARDDKALKSLNLANAKHIVTLAGKDTDNLEIALSLSRVIKHCDISIKKLYMHIDDRGLEKLYKEGGLLDDHAMLEVKMFSVSRNGAKALFLEHSIDGESMEYMRSDKPFALAVVGLSDLALAVVGQIGELAHLPNENAVTIYCVDGDSEAFAKAVALRYPHIDKIPNITLQYVSRSYNERDFYTDALWHDEITHVILCHEEAQTNLDIASELADSTYLEQIVDATLKTKIHIAIYEHSKIADDINRNEEHFRYFDVFAETAKMVSHEMVVDEKFETIARCIHAGYEERYNKDTMFGDEVRIEKRWHETARLTDRDSNRAQAYHIPLKLKALGYGYEPSDRPHAERLMHNMQILTQGALADELKRLGLDVASLEDKTRDYDTWEKVQSFDFFPEAFETMVEKLMRAEHNRWNAHHYLKGWIHTPDKTDKSKHLHRCLVPMDQMDERDRYTALYDLYSILYIPHLLAKAGFEVVRLCEED